MKRNRTFQQNKFIVTFDKRLVEYKKVHQLITDVNNLYLHFVYSFNAINTDKVAIANRKLHCSVIALQCWNKNYIEFHKRLKTKYWSEGVGQAVMSFLTPFKPTNEQFKMQMYVICTPIVCMHLWCVDNSDGVDENL